MPFQKMSYPFKFEKIMVNVALLEGCSYSDEFNVKMCPLKIKINEFEFLFLYTKQQILPNCF